MRPAMLPGLSSPKLYSMPLSPVSSLICLSLSFSFVPTVTPPVSDFPGTRGERRPARYGLGIQFESRPDDPELAQLVESTVWVNEAHPAYRRAVASRSEGYHVALSVAMALAPLAVDPAKEHGFITAFLASWGAARDGRRGRRKP